MPIYSKAERKWNSNSKVEGAQLSQDDSLWTIEGSWVGMNCPKCCLGETSFTTDTQWHIWFHACLLLWWRLVRCISALVCYFLIPLFMYSCVPCRIFVLQPEFGRLRRTVRFACWSLFLDLECELLMDLINLFHGMYLWYCFLAWYMNSCLPFRCLDAANFYSIWTIFSTICASASGLIADLSFLTPASCVEALESLNLSSEDIILVSKFEALTCVWVWNGWLGRQTGKIINFYPLSLLIQLEVEKWPSFWLS